MNNLSFTIPGPPVGKERPRVVNGRTFTPKKTIDYERLVQGTFIGAQLGRAWDRGGQFSVQIYVSVCSLQHPDCDNIAKAILDALNGHAWDDDKQVTQVYVSVNYLEAPPSVRVTLLQTHEASVVEKLKKSLARWRKKNEALLAVVMPPRRVAARARRL